MDTAGLNVELEALMRLASVEADASPNRRIFVGFGFENVRLRRDKKMLFVRSFETKVAN